MDGNRLLRYSMQLSMLKQLLSKKLINESEYQLIQCELPEKFHLNKNEKKKCLKKPDFLRILLAEDRVLCYNCFRRNSD